MRHGARSRLPASRVSLCSAGGRVKTWKRRWFILTDNCLYYFEYTTVSVCPSAVGPGVGPACVAAAALVRCGWRRPWGRGREGTRGEEEGAPGRTPEPGAPKTLWASRPRWCGSEPASPRRDRGRRSPEGQAAA